jgi:hypothetical protein
MPGLPRRLLEKAVTDLTATEHTMQTTTPIPTPAARTSRGPLHAIGRPHRPHATPSSAGPRARFAALVDLENAVIVAGGRIPAEQRRDLFEALDHHLAGMPVRAASGGPVVKACVPELAHRGWGLTLVSPEPDAADHALIEAGLHLTSAGVTDLVVVSGDHAFARLAPAARLHVITHPAQLSTALRLAAITVTHLPAPQAATRATA